jgi:hypothetical protein
MRKKVRSNDLLILELKNLWPSKQKNSDWTKGSQGISSLYIKLEGLRDQGNGGEWKLDMES